MSHIRNRFRSSSPAFNLNKKNSLLSTKLTKSINFMHENTGTSSLLSIPHHKTRPNTSEQKSYTRNVHHFRDIFNPNDKSQLPFMAALRKHPKNNSPPKNTISQGFNVAAKTTCNQQIRKKISDFKCKQRRLSGAYYRWHNQTGRNSLWSTQYECSLRNYEQNEENENKYYSFIKPITYQDVEPRIYSRNEMICSRHRKSFSLK